MLISIIVPVYNLSSCIEVCMDSLEKQTKQNFEVLIIDDGSKDNSKEKCKRYSDRLNNFFYFEKKNGGLSDARNFGMERSKGKYILFLDGDDYLELNTCEQFENALIEKRVDIVCGIAKRIENNNITEYTISTPKGICSGAEFLKNELKANTMTMASCFRLYNRTFLEKNKIYFEKKLLHEDEEFSPRAFLNAEQVLVTDIRFYNYVIRSESITQKKNKNNNGLDVIKIAKKNNKLITSDMDSDLKKQLENYLVTLILLGYVMLDPKNINRKDLVNSDFFKGKNKDFKNKIKVILFIFSRTLYYKIYYYKERKK